MKYLVEKGAIIRHDSDGWIRVEGKIDDCFIVSDIEIEEDGSIKEVSKSHAISNFDFLKCVKQETGILYDLADIV